MVAAFCLTHLPDPDPALREARRVSRAVSASAFAADRAVAGTRAAVARMTVRTAS